jgi:hypothetical protein
MIERDLIRESPKWSLLLMSAALVACSGGSGSPDAHEWQAAYDTIGDTLVVRTLSGSVWGDTAELVADVRIGEFEGADEYMFGRVRSLAITPDGSIYVFDSQAKELRKYSADGTYVGTFGRDGGGPGEYERPDGGLAVLPDGRVLLRDPGNARISVFASDGEYLESWRIRGGFNTSRILYLDTAGNAYVMLLLDYEARVTDWQFGLVRYTPDGVPSDTILPPSWDYEPPSLVAERVDGDNRSMSVNSVPFTAQDGWTFSPLGYMVGGVPTRYSFDLYVAPDRVLRIERDNWEPIPVQVAEKEERERIATANSRQTEPGWRWNGPPIPDTKPPYTRLFIGQSGRIWVQLHQRAHQVEDAEELQSREAPGAIPEQTWIEPVAFDVFEPDGRYLGMVRAPEGFSARPWPVMRGDTVWAVVRDELDVPYIVRFHIEHSADAT